MENDLKTIEKKYEIEISKFKKLMKIPENEKINRIKIGGGIFSKSETIKIYVNLKN